MVLIGLIMIYILFKPMHIEQQEFTDVPLFELSDFNIYELSEKGLTNIMIGAKATRYNDRYTVTQIDYTDNSRNYIANMKAKEGLYRDDIIDLDGDVIYTREDGLTFSSKSVTYNKKTSIAFVEGDYISYRGNDKITGTALEYNNLLNRVKSKNVVANYNF